MGCSLVVSLLKVMKTGICALAGVKLEAQGQGLLWDKHRIAVSIENEFINLRNFCIKLQSEVKTRSRAKL